MKSKYLVEVCANSVESCIEAEKGGAERVELCDNLFEGGTTPSAAMIQLAREKISIDLNVIIRPRGGDFCYSDLEFETMKKDIQFAKKLGADGVVFGILTPEGEVDRTRNKELVELSQPLSTTFHRAFDMVKDPFRALNDIINLDLSRILTSGLRQTAYEGMKIVSKLIEEAEDQIIIMPGSGIRSHNIKEIALRTKAKEFHTSGKKLVESAMRYRNRNINMGGLEGIPEYEKQITDAPTIAGIIKILREIENNNHEVQEDNN